MKEKIKIIDTLFKHAKYSTDNQESKYIEWIRNDINNNDIVFYTDNNITSAINDRAKRKFGWLLESPKVTPSSYKWIRSNYNNFELIFTHNKTLLDLNEKFKFAPTGGCWIFPNEQKIYNKYKDISIISSNKNYLEGHKLRHNIIKKYKIDVFGRGYNPIKNKLNGLKDYRFSFAIENTKEDYYFTEKLIDCFMTGTIPIYWGCPSIDNFFNIKGMIIINDININISKLNKETYDNMLPYVKENFEKAKDYLMSEDYIWKKYFLKK